MPFSGLFSVCAMPFFACIVLLSGSSILPFLFSSINTTIKLNPTHDASFSYSTPYFKHLKLITYRWKTFLYLNSQIYRTPQIFPLSIYVMVVKTSPAECKIDINTWRNTFLSSSTPREVSDFVAPLVNITQNVIFLSDKCSYLTLPF